MYYIGIACSNESQHAKILDRPGLDMIKARVPSALPRVGRVDSTGPSLDSRISRRMVISVVNLLGVTARCNNKEIMGKK